MENSGLHRFVRANPQSPFHRFSFTNRLVKSRTERVKVHSSVSGTATEGASTQLSMTYWSGAPPTNA